MKLRNQIFFALAVLGLLGGLLIARSSSHYHAVASAKTSAMLGMTVGTPDIKTAGALAFGPENILFVGDTQGAAIFAIDVKDSEKDNGNTPIEIKNIDQKIASLLGTTPDAVLINDLATHQISQNIYLSVSRGRGNDAMPAILKVTKSGKIEDFALKDVTFSKANLSNAPDPAAKTQWGDSKRKLAITDLAFADGELLVAGLSNAEFASTLHRMHFPFNQNSAATTLEIYHASHGRFETHAPIETFLPFRVNGKSSLLAGYGCAPLAAFSMADLKEKKHLRGTTLAELGGGNRPLDMIALQKNGKDYVLVANSNRTLMSISAEDIDKAEPVTKPVGAPYVTAGVGYVSVAQVGIMQLDNLNANFAVVIQRDIDTGALNLRSLPKRWL
ncbi:MAG: hypothetical protein L0226_17070 [Acidobacteria bacterium]|nr:hypothetical protein [Acidobacteriota bacterium]